MKHWMLCYACFACSLLVKAQSPFSPQLAIPVYVNSMAQTVAATTAKQPTSIYLSGISLLFLDTANTADELFVTSGNDLVIWHDNVGKSTKVSFIVPDSQFIGRLELMFFDAKCAADLWWQDRNTGATHHAAGELLTDEQLGYSLHFTCEAHAIKHLAAIFHPLNVQLMKLHARHIRKVAVKSWFNKDSINVIIGADSQFDTEYDLFWLDQSLRNRLHSAASNAYSKLFLFNSEASSVQDSLTEGDKQLHNRAERKNNGVSGTLTIDLKPDGSARYVFLKPTHTYAMTVDYTFTHVLNRPGELSINHLGLRDVNTGDFVEMDLYDFVNNGLPVMYVDLIRGAVTSEDPWDITNVIHAIEDVVAASRLPLE